MVFSLDCSVELEPRLVDNRHIINVVFVELYPCLFACLLGFEFGLSFAYWSLEIGLNYERIYGYRRRHGCLLHLTSRISHLASCILHPASRLSSCLSRSLPFHTSASLLSRHLTAALPPFTLLQSLRLRLCLHPRSMFPQGRIQRREGCKETTLLIRSGLAALT
jgi:hypothetical protein